MDTSAIDNFINKYKEEINELKTKISSEEDPEKEFNLLQKIAEKYEFLQEKIDKITEILESGIVNY